jgi:hypothetical protein
MVVVLPEPFGPMKLVTMPGFTSKLKSSTAKVEAYHLVRWRASIFCPHDPSVISSPRRDRAGSGRSLLAGTAQQHSAHVPVKIDHDIPRLPAISLGPSRCAPNARVPMTDATRPVPYRPPGE